MMNAERKRVLLFSIQHSAFSFLYLSFIILLTSCASVDPVVKVGLVGPFEGQHRSVGYDVIYSARLAVREINKAGGIGGYKVALVALDDSSNPEFAQDTAVSLTFDPAVVAVIGHWNPETTTAAAPIYAAANMPFIAGGSEPFTSTNPDELPPEFHTAYEAVTPFDETAGPYAGPAYDAFQLLWHAFDQASQNEGIISRTAVNKALSNLSE